MLALWIGRFADGVAVLESLAAELVERGEECALPFVLWQLTCGAAWQGDLDRAAHYADQALDVAIVLGHAAMQAAANSAAALVAAYRGRLDEARALAERALALVKDTEWVLARRWPVEVLTLIEVTLERPDAVVEMLTPVHELMLARGLTEPGVLRSLPDHVEALTALGRTAQAEKLLDQFEQRARMLDRPWALAGAARCRGALAAARGELTAASVALERSLLHHTRIEMPFDRARTLLALGCVHRRAKQRAQARDAFAEAAAMFEWVGAPGWAEKARAELARCGTRSGSDELTASERRIAELAAQGLTNREIAATAFISAKTVEANLARAYRKLGIRSRAELGALLGNSPPTAPSTQKT
jgi:DNA-binding CsgD family transcriptional regulator